MFKKCPKCQFSPCRKNGKRNGKQRYKCKACNYVRENKSKKLIHRNNDLYETFASGKQTYKQLAKSYNMSVVQIQSCLDRYNFKKRKLLQRDELYC